MYRTFTDPVVPAFGSDDPGSRLGSGFGWGSPEDPEDLLVRRRRREREVGPQATVHLLSDPTTPVHGRFGHPDTTDRDTGSHVPRHSSPDRDPELPVSGPFSLTRSLLRATTEDSYGVTGKGFPGVFSSVSERHVWDPCGPVRGPDLYTSQGPTTDLPAHT